MDVSERVKAIAPSLTLEMAAKANKMKADGKDVVSFSAGEPDFNTPDYVLEAGHEALYMGLTKYTPASGTVKLKEAICEKLERENGLHYTTKSIVVSNGAKHSLSNACLATLNEGDEAILPSPYWLTYPELIKLAGGVPKYVPTQSRNGFKITADELKSAITEKTKLFILNNPNNPTGAVYTKKELESLARVLEDKDIYIIADEIYEKLVYGCKHYTFPSFGEKIKERTILINGMSKTYAMTGWRIGYSAANEKLTSAMSSLQSHCTSNPNSIAQWASYKALTGKEGDEFLQTMKATFTSRRELILKLLKAAKIEYVEPMGAFYVMVSVRPYFGKSFEGQTIDSAHEFAHMLLDNAHIATVPCESFGAPDYLRLSYAASERDIERGIDAFAQFVKKLTA